MPDATFWRRLQVAKDSYTRLIELVDELADELQAADMEIARGLDDNAALQARISELEDELKAARDLQ